MFGEFQFVFFVFFVVFVFFVFFPGASSPPPATDSPVPTLSSDLPQATTKGFEGILIEFNDFNKKLRGSRRDGGGGRQEEGGRSE